MPKVEIKRSNPFTCKLRYLINSINLGFFYFRYLKLGFLEFHENSLIRLWPSCFLDYEIFFNLTSPFINFFPWLKNNWKRTIEQSSLQTQENHHCLSCYMISYVHYDEKHMFQALSYHPSFVLNIACEWLIEAHILFISKLF